jgi:hypothetical protein
MRVVCYCLTPKLVKTVTLKCYWYVRADKTALRILEITNTGYQEHVWRIWGSHNNGYEEFYLLSYNVTCFHAGFLIGLFFDLNTEDTCSSGRWIDFNGLGGVISQKTELFKTYEGYTVCDASYR